MDILSNTEPIKGETYPWLAIEELSDWPPRPGFKDGAFSQKGDVFVSGDDMAFDMINDALGHRREPMNPETGKIVYGTTELIDQHGKEHGVKMVPIPGDIVGSLTSMSYGERMAWMRRNRPTLEQVAENPAGLSTTQQKAVDKKARKKAARRKAADIHLRRVLHNRCYK